MDEHQFDSPHVKANLLLQAHFSGVPFPISDFNTDLKNVLDQSVRILQAMVDVAADAGWLFATLNTTTLFQMVIQGRWNTESSLLQLPRFTPVRLAPLSLPLTLTRKRLTSSRARTLRPSLSSPPSHQLRLRPSSRATRP